MVEAVAAGTGRIMDSLSGKGASFAVDLHARVRAEVTEGGGVEGEIDPLVREITGDMLDFFGYDYGLKVEVESEIPSSAGMGEREAVSAATVTAVAGALAKKHGSVNELRIDKYMKEQFLVVGDRVVDKKRLTDFCSKPGLEFDRVSASFHGGFTVTDNTKKTILRRGEMESLHAVILTPAEKQEIDFGEPKLFRNELEVIWGEALKGNLYTAMKLNTLFYGSGAVKDMLKAGSLTATVSFPSVIALVRDEALVRRVADSVKKEGRILTTKICNRKAEVLGKPKRIYKINEFLELKGKQEFHLI